MSLPIDSYLFRVKPCGIHVSYVFIHKLTKSTLLHCICGQPFLCFCSKLMITSLTPTITTLYGLTCAVAPSLDVSPISVTLSVVPSTSLYNTLAIKIITTCNTYYYALYNTHKHIVHTHWFITYTYIQDILLAFISYECLTYNFGHCLQ